MRQQILIQRRKLFEQVAAHIQNEILTGTLRPGDRLPPEKDLRVRFGVGRPAIREALIALQRAGLVEIGNGAPARVATPTAEGVMAGMQPAIQQILTSSDGQRQLQGVRLFMEVGLVRHAAQNATDEELSELSDALEANRRSIGNSAAFIQTDIAFHFVFARIMRNPAFLALHEALSAWLRQQREIALLEPGEDQRGYEAHARIFEAVSAKDANAAEGAMREHLSTGWIAFWHRFQG